MAMTRLFVVATKDARGETVEENKIDDCGMDATVAALAAGQYDCPTRIFELREVTQEVAAAVAEHSHSEMRELPRDVAAWCERNGADPWTDPEPDWDAIREMRRDDARWFRGA
jgi:predicted ATP-grasp superfamily ATP-dependent carboligase